MNTTRAYTARRSKLLGLIVLGLAASAAGLLLPHTPGLLGNISRTMFGAAAAAAFIFAVVHAVQLSAAPDPAVPRPGRRLTERDSP